MTKKIYLTHYSPVLLIYTPEVSTYFFANEKKIYNEITEIKYINFVNWVSLKD